MGGGAQKGVAQLCSLSLPLVPTMGTVVHPLFLITVG